MAMQRLHLDEDELSETLVAVLRRYIYYIEERDIEIDIRREENINQFHLLSNYSSSMTEILKSVSMSLRVLKFFYSKMKFLYNFVINR